MPTIGTISQSERLAASGRAVGRAVGFAPKISSTGAGWSNIALFAWRGHCREAAFEPLTEPAVVYHTAGATSVPVRFGRTWDQHSHPGLVTVIPPATPITWNVRGEVHSFSAHLGGRFFASATDREDNHICESLRFLCGVSDQLLAVTITELANELRDPSQKGSLYADAICDVMALHLIRLSLVARCDRGPRDGLSPVLLRRTLDLLESSIEYGVSLGELAKEASLSRSHFSEAFRKSLGVSPHRYLTGRRVARAQDLLRNTMLPLIEISARCGFASQAHFTTQFHKVTGTTPGRFRKLWSCASPSK